MSVPVCFYVPRQPPLCDELPSSVADYWPWLSSQTQVSWWGKFNWTLQTYLYLNAAGVPCELVRTVPDHGIVLAHRDFLSDDIEPGRARLLVCLIADRRARRTGGRHPFAQVHVVQNPTDDWIRRPSRLWRAFYMPQWPQPGLLARDPRRGDRFERVVFFGYDSNLAAELRDPSWRSELERLGLSWEIPPRARWHDYRDVDAVVAVRSFDEQTYSYKPPSKLFNCWHAGVPAVLGRESAYRANRQNDLDYLEVTTVREALGAIARLREDPQLRQAMTDNGHARAREVQVDRFVERWRHLLVHDLVPIAKDWIAASTWERTQFLTKRRLLSHREVVARRLRPLTAHADCTGRR